MLIKDDSFVIVCVYARYHRKGLEMCMKGEGDFSIFIWRFNRLGVWVRRKNGIASMEFTGVCTLLSTPRQAVG